MSQISVALARAAVKLAATSPTPRLDAELLMAAALGIERDRLLLDSPPGAPPPSFESFIRRRSAGEPIAYLTGRRGFWTIDLEVGPGVLIPRPDSETLLNAAVDHFAGSEGPRRILDLGTGPGTLLLAALDQWPEATGLGVDRSTVALSFARRNALRLGMAERAMLRQGDWAQGIEERFDLLLANPPYIALDATLGAGVREHEPPEALFSGEDGLDDLRRIAGEVGRLVRPGGLAAVEIGSDQAEAALGTFAQFGRTARVAQDLAGRPRALVMQFS